MCAESTIRVDEHSSKANATNSKIKPSGFNINSDSISFRVEFIY